MRMFAALSIPPLVAADLERFLEPRMDVGGPWRWVPPANWHITLAFLNEVSLDRLVRLSDVLSVAVARSAPFEMRLSGAGVFPNVTCGKHLYQAVSEPTGALAALALHVRNAGQQAGLARDPKPFIAHLSTARTSHPLDVTKWLRVLDTYESPLWCVTEVQLYRSELGVGINGHPRYSVEETFRLGG